MDEDLVPIRAAVLAELRRQPVVSSWRFDAATLLGVNLTVTAVVIAAGLHFYREGAVRWPSALPLFALVACGSIAAVSPSGRRARHVLTALALLTVPVLLAARSQGNAASFLSGADCALAEIGVSLVPGLATVIVLRRFSYSPFRALVGGLAAAATGMLALDVTCAVGTVAHVAAFHLTPYVVVVAALVAVRSRLSSRTYVP